MGNPAPEDVRAHLLAWYDANRRDLPWRRTQDPYRILIAEFLLQRTRIASGTPYYERFLARFPTVRDLAVASLDDVLAVWEGLGFYGRARNLHAAAQAIVARHGGDVPRSFDELESLPGVGPYTAGAVGSIAFGIPVPAVDGNVTRVIARLFRIREDVTKGPARRRIAEIAARLVSPVRPGAFNQAMMELGATVCTPTCPACVRCPLENRCLGRAAGEERDLPLARRPTSPPVIHVVFAVVRRDDAVLAVRRPDRGLLGGLWALPGGEHGRKRDEKRALTDLVRDQTGVPIRIGSRVTRVSHTFSHRRWRGAIYRCEADAYLPLSRGARWIPLEKAAAMPFVPFHRKAIEAAMK